MTGDFIRERKNSEDTLELLGILSGSILSYEVGERTTRVSRRAKCRLGFAVAAGKGEKRDARHRELI